MSNVLVLANETLSGIPLLNAVLDRNAVGDANFLVVVPQNRPNHGGVIYDEAVRDATQLRVDLALSFLRDAHIEAAGEIGDGNPLNAALDAIAMHGIDEIIVSTLPHTSSGWLRQDLIERLRSQTGLPVTHVVVDVDAEEATADITLVVANLTVACSSLITHLKSKAAKTRHRFIVVVPQDSGDGSAVKAARTRLHTLLGSLENAGLVCAGMIGNPDPHTAIMNALQFFVVGDIVISTLPESSSKWIESDLINRTRRSTGKTVEHIVSNSGS